MLLLDEPLSNLDAKMRDQARVWLKDLQREVGITTVYVTHDQVEAMSLSDRIAVFMHGHLQQVGTPTEIYETPATPEVAGFIGRCNLLEGRVGATEGGAVQVELGETGQRLRVAGACSAGSSATVGLRSERITLTDRADAPHDGAVNVLGRGSSSARTPERDSSTSSASATCASMPRAPSGTRTARST